MFVIQKDQTDGNRPENDPEQRPEAIHAGLHDRLDARQCLDGGDVHVHARRDRQYDPRRLVRGRRGEEDHPAQHDRHPRDEVEAKGAEHGQSAVAGEEDEIPDLLRDLVHERHGDDREGERNVASHERRGDEHPVGEVVKRIAEYDRGDEPPVVHGLDHGDVAPGAFGDGGLGPSLLVAARRLRRLRGLGRHRHARVGRRRGCVVPLPDEGTAIHRDVVYVEEDGEDQG